MEQERSIDKFARLLIIAAGVALIALVGWYFRGVLSYILVAFVVSLIGQPVMKLLRKVRIRGKSAPDTVLAVLTLVIITGGILLILTQIIPVIVNILSDPRLTSPNLNGRELIRQVNDWAIAVIPWLDEDFDLFKVLVEKLSGLVNVSVVPGIVGSLASTVAGFVVGTFSVVFISFFFIKDEHLFGRIVGAIVPDRIEQQVARTVLDVEHLLSRYFSGLVVEMIGVAVLDLLGLWLIARIGFNYALGITFIAGLLNVIPYVGPLIGEVLGVVLCVVLKYGMGLGLDVNIWLFAAIVLGIMLATQLVDNFIYQPLIYSTSIKAHPLEIFIVLLIAGHVGGTIGMLVAIPSYTVVRVIASRFFYNLKPVRRLIPDVEQEEGNEPE